MIILTVECIAIYVYIGRSVNHDNFSNWDGQVIAKMLLSRYGDWNRSDVVGADQLINPTCLLYIKRMAAAYKMQLPVRSIQAYVYVSETPSDAHF